ncbi:MAG: chemotaxis protein CheX [Leptospiraceae bacterium]|nr:chemotaxis protein CheX [Leptospiraceae bacterium]
MKEHELNHIISTIENYFQEVSSEKAILGIPYTTKIDEPIFEFTGIIGISGNRKGAIYVSAESKLLEQLTLFIIGEDNPGKTILNDMVGELSNTIAGNICSAFGNEFTITVPIVVSGKVNDIVLQKLSIPIFVIPITWKNSKCKLVIGID